MDFLICISSVFNVIIFIDVCACAPLNYLTSERNSAIEMQHNNNNNRLPSYNFRSMMRSDAPPGDECESYPKRCQVC